MQALVEMLRHSPLWQEAAAEGKAEGEVEGEARARAERLAAERALCLELVARRHPALLDQAAPRIRACGDPALLESWILAASEPDGAALARLLAAGERS